MTIAVEQLLNTSAAMSTGKTILLWLLGIIVAGGVGTLIAFGMSQVMKYSKYTIRVWFKDGNGQWNLRRDKAGVFVDKKSNSRRLWLKKGKVGLSADDIPFIYENNKKVIYLLMIGEKNYRYIRHNISDKGLTYQVGEEDVNWAIAEFDRQQKILKGNFEQMAFMIGLIVVCVAIVMLMIIYGNNWVEIITKGQEVAAQSAESIAKAAEYLAQANSGVMVVD